MNEFLRLDLQFFAEGGEQGQEGQEGSNQQGQEGQAGGQEDQQQQNQEQQNNQQQQEKTFTQKELNAIAAKESKSAIEKFLKDNGFTDFNNAKEGMAKFKEWNESQKTEAQKTADKLKDLQGTNSTLAEEKQALEAKLAGFQAGITDEKALNAVVTLAKTRVNDETDITAAIAQVVEEFPQFKGQAQEQNQGPTFSNNNFQRQSKDIDPFVAALGLKS